MSSKVTKKEKNISSFFKPKTKPDGPDLPVKEEPEVVKPKKVVVIPKNDHDPKVLKQIEDKLREFDNCVYYGPVIGMTRMQRYERAVKYNLNPPAEIKELLEDERANQACYFDQTKLHQLEFHD